MHPDDFPARAAQIEDLHRTWCGLTRTKTPLDRPQIAAWHDWLEHNPPAKWGTNHLLAVVVYLRAGKEPCEFADLIEQPENFARLLDDACTAMRLRY